MAGAATWYEVRGRFTRSRADYVTSDFNACDEHAAAAPDSGQRDQSGWREGKRKREPTGGGGFCAGGSVSPLPSRALRGFAGMLNMRV